MAAETLELTSVSPTQLLLSQILSNRQTEIVLPVDEEKWGISLSSIASDVYKRQHLLSSYCLICLDPLFSNSYVINEYNDK